MKTMEQMKSKPTGDADNRNSDVEIIECIRLDKPKIWVNPLLRSKPTEGAFGQSERIIRDPPIPSSMGNVTHIPLPLVTPPWSANDTSMPILTSLMSGNHQSINIPPRNVLSIPCYLCQKLFYDVDLLKEHLRQHGMEMYLNSVQPRVTGQPTVQQPFLTSPNVYIPSEQSTQPPKETLYHAEKYFECPICKIRLNSPERLEHHHRRVHRWAEVQRLRRIARPFACMHCKASYKKKGYLLRHLKAKHNFNGFAKEKEPVCRIPSPCSSAASTSESTSTKTSNGLLNSEPADDYYPNSGEIIAPRERFITESAAQYCRPSKSTTSASVSSSTETSTGLLHSEPAVDYYPNSGQLTAPNVLFNAEPSAGFYPASQSPLQSPLEQTSTRVFKTEPADDYYPNSGEIIAPGELFNAKPAAEYCRLSESTTSASKASSTDTSSLLIKTEPGVDVQCGEASESDEDLAAKAAAYYCPPAKWAAMGLPFGDGYFIPLDPNGTYPLLQDGCCPPEFNQWISEEDMAKYIAQC